MDTGWICITSGCFFPCRLTTILTLFLYFCLNTLHTAQTRLKESSSEHVWQHSGPIPSALLARLWKQSVLSQLGDGERKLPQKNLCWEDAAVQEQQQWICSTFNSISLRGGNAFCHRAAAAIAGNDSLTLGRTPSQAGRGPLGPFGVGGKDEGGDPDTRTLPCVVSELRVGWQSLTPLHTLKIHLPQSCSVCASDARPSARWCRHHNINCAFDFAPFHIFIFQAICGTPSPENYIHAGPFLMN